MTADEIRTLNEKLQAQMLEADSVAGHEAGMRSLQLSLLAEVAAQLAELNTHMGRLEWLAENTINLQNGGVQVKLT